MKPQSGFTLLELIMVMTIMSILVITAASKMSDVTADARLAKMQGLVASLKTSSVMTHGSAEAELLAPNNPLTMEDGTAVAMFNSYPEASASGIGNTFDNWGYASSVVNGVSVTFFPDEDHSLRGTCGVVYTHTNNVPYIDTSAISSVAGCL